MVKTEQINNKQFIIEESTNIIFDSDITNPKVIGKKLSDNLSQNLGLSQTALAEAIEEEGPLFYLTRATLALARIDIKNQAFEGQFVEAKIKDINDFTWEFKKALKEKSKNNE